MVPVGLGIVVTRVIGRCGNAATIGCTVRPPPEPPPFDPPPEPVPPEPDEPPFVDSEPAEPVDTEPVLAPVPAVPSAPAAPAEPALTDDCPEPGPPLPLVTAAVPAVTCIPVPSAAGAWCTGKMIATATAAADARLPAIAAVLASALMSISLWFTHTR